MNRLIPTKKIIKAVMTSILLLALQGVVCSKAIAQAVKWIAPAEACELKNPLEGNTQVLNNAHVLYNNMCAPCHGYKGRGDGPVSCVLNPKPADHTSTAIQSEPDGALFWKMTTGKGQMQPYESTLTEVQRWSIVNYIRTLKSQ